MLNKMNGLSVLVLAIIAGATAVEFEIRNTLSQTIWVGIQGKIGHPHLENGGFPLDGYKIRTITSNDNWSGIFWARTHCDSKTNKCQTGDCGGLECAGKGGQTPVTVAEITLRSLLGGGDYYYISLVNGYNVRVLIEPVNGRGDCKITKCETQINDICPNELKLTGGSFQDTVGCFSSCDKFNTDQYCCRGAYSTPDTCKTDNWTVNSAKLFGQACPNAYSYVYDGGMKTFSCTADKYKITFGP